MPRQARLDAAGTLHHVMIRGIDRRRIVDDERDRRDFALRLGRLAVETGTSIYARALMNSHAHLLLSSGPAGLAKFMRRFLTGYAVTYNLRHDRYGHLFQNRYKSIVCDGDSYFTELVRYVHLHLRERALLYWRERNYFHEATKLQISRSNLLDRRGIGSGIRISSVGEQKANTSILKFD
jgi:REP element-mobilizing transposase RayT